MIQYLTEEQGVCDTEPLVRRSPVAFFAPQPPEPRLEPAHKRHKKGSFSRN